MPFPFLAAIGSSIIGTIAAAGTAVGAAVATASASTLIIGGIAVAAGAALTAGAVSAYNDEKRAKIRASAESSASRERERILAEEARKKNEELKKCQEEYGDNPPEEKIKKIWEDKLELLGQLEGNRIGLQKQNQKASPEAVEAEEELKKQFKDAGVSM